MATSILGSASDQGTVDTQDLSLLLDLEQVKETDALIERCWRIYQYDRTKFRLIDDYLAGNQPGPYIPTDSGDEYKLLAERAITNLLPTMRDTPARSLFVEGYREAEDPTNMVSTQPGEKVSKSTPLWSVWQRNGLDAKQVPVASEICGIGQSFIGVKMPNPSPGPGLVPYNYPKAFTLSGMRTVALYEDPTNDEWPIFVCTFDREPMVNSKPGRGRYWDNLGNYEKFEIDSSGNKGKSIEKGKHGFDRCPIVPFVCTKDLLGRTRGIIEQLIPMQDRLNQTIFDLLVAQTYGSFKVRYATGMTPPPQREKVPITVGEVRSRLDTDHPLFDAPADTIYGYRMVAVVDDQGNPVPAPISADITRFLVAEDHETRFGDLDATPLDGFIASAGMSLSHLATISQLPPHYLLGNIANLSLIHISE